MSPWDYRADRLTLARFRRARPRRKARFGYRAARVLVVLITLAGGVVSGSESVAHAAAYNYSFVLDGGTGFEVNGVSGSLSGTKEAGTAFSTDDCYNATKEGFTLYGWRSSHNNKLFTKTCGSGNGIELEYFNGAFNVPYEMPASDVNFTATWLASELNITYDINYVGGSAPSGGDATTTTGATISALPTDPTRSGYTFNGWYTASSGGTQITTSASHGQTSDFTLYAQWSPNSYDYSFDNGGGGNTPFGGTQATGTAINWGASCKGPGTSRPGYTLLGFRSSHDSDVYGTDCGGGYFSLNGFTMPSEDVVFTFAWELNITYDSQGGTAVADATTSVGATISELPTDPTRSGYTFAGWYTASSGGTQITAGASHGQESHFTLYARWAGDALTISYDSQGGSAPSGGDTTTTSGGLVNPLPTPPTRSGYTLTGWNTEADGTGSDLGVVVSGFSDGVAHGQTSDFTLYAQWLGDLLNITYDSQSGSAVADGDTTTRIGATVSALPTDPTRSGYTFNGWYTASSGGTQITTSASHGQTSDFTLYAQWTVVPVASPSPPTSSSSAPTTALSTITVTVAGGTSREVNHQTTRIETALEVEPGGLISVTGQHYERFSTVELWINSTPRLLATVQVGSDTAFDLSVPIPSDIEAGEHTLQINGTSLDGNLQTTLIAIQVGASQVTSPDVTTPETAAPGVTPPATNNAPDPELPATGGTAPASVGLILISCGMFLIAIRDRRLPFVRRDLRA